MRMTRLVPALAFALAVTAGCGQEGELLATPVDDAAHPVGRGGPKLSGGFDRDLGQLAAALPVQPLGEVYSEVQTLPTETLEASETNVCRDGGEDPALPATEVLATRRPPEGHDQPESVNIVAARAQNDPQAEQFTQQAFTAMRDCTQRNVPGRDLGEGSYAPAEQVDAVSENIAVEGWTGVRHTASVELTSNTWRDRVTQEWVVLRQGQIVVSIRVEGVEEPAVRDRTDELVRSVTDVLDGRRETPAPLVELTAEPTDGTATDSPTAQPTGSTSPSSSPTASATQTGDAEPTSTRESEDEDTESTAEPTGRRSDAEESSANSTSGESDEDTTGTRTSSTRTSSTRSAATEDTVPKDGATARD